MAYGQFFNLDGSVGNVYSKQQFAGAGNGGGAPGFGAGASPGGMFGFGSGSPEDAKLEEARKRAFGSLDQGSNIFRGSLGNATSSNLEARVGGLQQPYDQATQDRMFGAAADQSAAAAAAQEGRMRDFFANSGTGGSGAQLSGLLDAATQHDQNMQAARSDISNRAQLENFGARERAGQQAGAYMGQQAGSEAPYRLKEADLLSRYEVTGQDPFAGLLGGRVRGGAQGPVDFGFRQAQPAAAPAPGPMGSPASYLAPASNNFRRVQAGGGVGWI